MAPYLSILMMRLDLRLLWVVEAVAEEGVEGDGTDSSWVSQTVSVR